MLIRMLPLMPRQIARLLLAYGADINVADKAGKKPRNVSGSCKGRLACSQRSTGGKRRLSEWARRM